MCARAKILNPESTTKAIVAEYHASLASAEASATPNVQSDKMRDSSKRKRPLDPDEEHQLQSEDAKKREKILKERLKLEEEENKRQIREEQERRERVETPRDALHRLYEPIFTALWDMDFPALGQINPFRMVIDKDNCAAMGVPDYCKVIEKPMNLTYIQTKVKEKKYDSLQEFVEDVELIAKNAMKYNHQADNPYHIAAKEFRKKFRKLVKVHLRTI